MQSDEPRLHNMPVALPPQVYFTYLSLKGMRCLHVDADAAAGASYVVAGIDVARWISKHPQTWKHAVLYGATEQRVP